MTSTKKTQTAFRNCRFLLNPAALLFVAGLTGCNTCVTFTSPNGTLGIVSSNPSPPCMLPKVMSAVRVHIATAPPCSSCAGSSQVRHIFLTIQGIELHANASAQGDSPGWQELLLPGLEQKPLQIDLMESDSAQGVQEPFRTTAVIPAGIYNQLRLRFVPNQPTPDDQLSQKNMCGSGTFNCIVMADGSIHPLPLGAGPAELRIASDITEDASLLFPPDGHSDLVIRLKVVWELSSSVDTGVRLVPALAGSASVLRD